MAQVFSCKFSEIFMNTFFTEIHRVTSKSFMLCAEIKLRKKTIFMLPGACNFIKKGTLAQVFSCEFCEISKNTFFTEHLLGYCF